MKERASVTFICLLVIFFGIRFFDAKSATLDFQSGLHSQVIYLSPHGPVAITTPGQYELTEDIHISDPSTTAIVIEADNVDLNLGGHTITGPFNPLSNGNGVVAVGKKNIFIHGGTVEGFLYGVYVAANTANSTWPENVQISQVMARSNFFRGIFVQALKARVVNNIVERTGGSALLYNSAGIDVAGEGCAVEGNRVVDTWSEGIIEAVGISVSLPNDGCTIFRNEITFSTRPRYGRNFAFWVSPPSGIVGVTENLVINATYVFLHGGADDPVKYTRNTFRSIDCSPKNLPQYYQVDPYTKENSWVDESGSCSDTEAMFRYAAEQGDPRAQYRLARIILLNRVNYGTPETNQQEEARLSEAYRFLEKSVHKLTGLERDIALHQLE